MLEGIAAQRSEDGTDGAAGARTFLHLEKARSSRPGEAEGKALDKGKSSKRVPCKPV